MDTIVYILNYIQKVKTKRLHFMKIHYKYEIFVLLFTNQFAVRMKSQKHYRTSEMITALRDLAD